MSPGPRRSAARREAVGQALGDPDGGRTGGGRRWGGRRAVRREASGVRQAAAGLKGRLTAGQTAVSIMAGVRIGDAAARPQHDAIVRVMPNTPGAIGEGASVWTATAGVSDKARGQVAAVLGAMGVEIYVDDEKYLDMATALSGSGPGFVYLLIEAFIDAGVHIGFRRDAAEKLALQTFAGAAKYAQARGDASWHSCATK